MTENSTSGYRETFHTLQSPSFNSLAMVLINSSVSVVGLFVNSLLALGKLLEKMTVVLKFENMIEKPCHSLITVSHVMFM